MFVPSESRKLDTLLQGDIIEETQYFGAMNLNNIFYAQTNNNNIPHWGVNASPQKGPAAILSHSCEVSRDNGVKLTSIILAPIRDINKASAKDKIEEIINSNIPNISKGYSYLKYFYIEPTGFIGEKYPQGCVVDFSKCYSLNKKAYDTLLNKKVMEMANETRKQFSLKNALFYFRNNPTL